MAPALFIHAQPQLVRGAAAFQKADLTDDRYRLPLFFAALASCKEADLGIVLILLALRTAPALGAIQAPARGLFEPGDPEVPEISTLRCLPVVDLFTVDAPLIEKPEASLFLKHTVALGPERQAAEIQPQMKLLLDGLRQAANFPMAQEYVDELTESLA